MQCGATCACCDTTTAGVLPMGGSQAELTAHASLGPFVQDGSPPAASQEQQQSAPDYPKEGDMVILYGSRDNIISCVLTRTRVCQTRLGKFVHADILKTPIGHKVFDRRNGKWMVVLRPTPDLHTLALRHRTQIIYHADISLILSLLDLRPGNIIIEAGTGSGSLSFALATALRPGGHLFTYEFHEQRWKEAKAEFELLGISSEVTSFHRDVCAEGLCRLSPPEAAGEGEEEPLPAPHSADGVFLDLPSPWLALKHADTVLKGGGRLVTFSPCVEQLHKTLDAAQELGFLDFQAFEILAKPWGACISRPSPDQQQQQKRTRDTSHQLSGEGESDEETQGPQEQEKLRASSFPALLSHFLQQPLPSFLSGDTAAAAGPAIAQVGAAPSATPATEVAPDGLSRISSYHYQLPMKGHTGYVALCVKPTEDESLQPLP